jgi:hypothetical protein
MELTAQEIEWVLYSVNKTINDNGGMWDNTLTDSIKLKLNTQLNTCPFCGVSPTDGCPTCEQAGRLKTGENK